MHSTNRTYTTFLFDWIVKSTSYRIQYRKAFNINDIDEIFCSIINGKGNEVNFLDFGVLLGFNLQDLAEVDILNFYLKGLIEYNLIVLNQKEQIIQLTEFGQEAIRTKLKYKYYFAASELLENQSATGESFDFPFMSVFEMENQLSHEREFIENTLENPEIKRKLQFQLFGNDAYKGEILEVYKNEPRICYKIISLQGQLIEFEGMLQLSVFKSDLKKTEVQFLLDLPENTEFKSKLLRKGMYHHILETKELLCREDIVTYIEFWSWKELAENPKLDWNDQTIFELFLENGDGGIWSIISEKAPIESIKSVIDVYPEYWNWTTLTERLDDEFIKEKIDTFNWDFEELSYKEPGLVTFLLSNLHLKEREWDWNYLSKNLPDKFIEDFIEDFPWDFYAITENKKGVFKNTFIKYRNKLETLTSKNWNWKFISQEINLIFLQKNIAELASKLNWDTVLNRFFINEEITEKCLKDELFKSLLKHYLPESFVIAHQKYAWTIDLIDFFENQNLIQWETLKYICGFDTNESVEWSKPIFLKYHKRINTENGFLNVSKQISDFTLISDFPDFGWNWQGISQNKRLISSVKYVEKAFIGELSFSSNLLWNEILFHSNFDISFWNKNLDTFYNTTKSEEQAKFWKYLTHMEELEFVFANKHFPWDWRFITESSSQEIILDSIEDGELLKKWDWEIATRKIEKRIILQLLERIGRYVDWNYLVDHVFTVENDLLLENNLSRISVCLKVLDNDKRKEIWKAITVKFPIENLFPILELTEKLEHFEWDWDYISNHKLFPTDFRTIDRFKERINWDIFSANQSIRSKFAFKRIEWTYQEYFTYIIKYLRLYRSKWNWNRLGEIQDLNNNRDIIRIFQDNWDWEYISEFAGFLLRKRRDKDDYLLSLLSDYPLIEFARISNRTDIDISADLIISTRAENWDWQVLSGNERAELKNEIIIELGDKNWDWRILSKHKMIHFTNEFILNFLDKDWDWNYLSENQGLEFNIDFIKKTKEKTWNWKLISRHRSFNPAIEILTLTKEYDLDWEYISKNMTLNPTKELLSKFENKWYWNSITENPQIDFHNLDFLERFAEKWNWRFICESGKLPITNDVLSKFKDHLEWNLISSNTNIHFTREIIHTFKRYWNWSKLKANRRVEELLGTFVADEVKKNATLRFIDMIEQQGSEWKGNIYHFSHIDNAVEIIKLRKIQSRNRALKTSDSAGKGVIDLRHDAHDYARFYFRPHTPTQFYNEFLGRNTNSGYNSKSHGWVSWYEKARGLGFPKCPVPIFFRFSIKEVLFKNDTKCFISNGNMQTSTTKFGSIDNMINKFGFDDLYYTPQQYASKEDYNRYRNYAQQEFLVKDELSFNDFSDFQIVCPSEADRELLKKLLVNEDIAMLSKIVVDADYYNYENPRVCIEQENSDLHISTNFDGEGFFVLTGESDLGEIDILAGDVAKNSKEKIIFKSSISLGNVKQNIQLNFIDESNRSWFLYVK